MGVRVLNLDAFFSFIHWLIKTKGHRTILLEARRGRGKSQTCFALVQRARDQGLKATYAQRPDQVRIANLLIIDDAGPFLYKRDSMKAANKAAAKSLQRARGAIEMLILNVPSIARLDIDLRENFSTHGQVLKHGWLSIEGVLLGPIIPDSLPPDDSKRRQKEFLEGFRSL